MNSTIVPDGEIFSCFLCLHSKKRVSYLRGLDTPEAKDVTAVEEYEVQEIGRKKKEACNESNTSNANRP